MRYNAWTATLLASFAALLMLLFLPKLGQTRDGAGAGDPAHVERFETTGPAACEHPWTGRAHPSCR